MSKIFEVEFSGGRRSFYANPQEFPFVVGDLAIVQAEKGEDLGRVVNMGSLVDQRAGSHDYPLILRKPSKKDMDQWEENQKLEREAFFDCRKRIEEHGLNMKLVDVEYQFDRNKITFYFTSEKRVDFRALVRDLASRYKTRIELRQIGVRDEAKRIGGVGVCGRRLCCEAFLREFEPVVTQFAKEQNLSLNPIKLSGSCGRLMCCLLYEREFYAEFAKQFPDAGSAIETTQGKRILKKIDVFEEQALLQLENGKEEKISLEELRRIVIEPEDKKRCKKTQHAEGHAVKEEKKDEA
jgi:cell fate regulator YaaT (PSP1 superfamily)